MIPQHLTALLLLITCVWPLCASSTCPLDLDYVQKIPWDSSSCSGTDTDNCCQTLTSLYGVAFAQRLKQTSLFRLPNLQTSISCLSNFQTKLHLPPHLISTCFDPQRFVNTTDVCAGIQTKQDLAARLGESSSLDHECRRDLSDLTACDACVLAGFRAQSRLLAHDGHDSHSTGCFHYTILYAAGVVNEFGPVSNGALSCIFGLPLIPAGGYDRSLVFAAAGAGLFSTVALTFSISFWFRRQKKDSPPPQSGRSPSDYDSDMQLLNWRPKAESLWYNIADIERVTDNISSKNLIGKGRFGVVYKGKLQDGSLIAVKKVANAEFEGEVEFFREVEIISSLKHRNLVPLRGCCIDGNNRFLVYEYMPNGNLYDRMFLTQGGEGGGGGGKMAMGWPERKNVILDVANALLYLHCGVRPPVYHRDIKPTNILLDSNMRARVADFGLARRGREGESHLTTRIAGTYGYLSPEYALYGQLTDKSDVYSFGIVVLEVMCGRKAIDFSSSPFLITDWAWPMVKEGKVEQVLDPCLLEGGYPRMIMERFVRVGILCAHLMVALRPTILDALKILEGDVEVPSVPDRALYAYFPTGTSL